MPPANDPQPASYRRHGGIGPASERLTYRRIYPLRMLGMGLGAVLLGSVLHDNQSPAWMWWLLGVTALVWPQLAYLLARHSADPYRAEVRNLLIDSAIAGMWVPLLHFNLLPCVVMALITTYDKFSTGIKRLWLHSLPGMAGMCLLMTLLLRPEPRLESSLLVVVCTLPLLIVHGLAVSTSSYRLIRTVARQNRELESLRRTDAQTGLVARSHWQDQAKLSLERFHASGSPACLLMIDIDHFKSINDLHGHTVGDEVIHAVGQVILDCVRAHDHAGRYGGDEFAVVLSGTRAADALAIAERIRCRIAALHLRDQPDLHLTSSIGLAQAAPHQAGLREWINDADAALYRAKNAGRNQVADHEAQTSHAAPPAPVVQTH